jgi:hypothetical protein
MSLPLTRSGSIDLTTITNPLRLSLFMTTVPSTSGRLNSEFVQLLFLQNHRETDLFFPASGVQVTETDRDQFHFRGVTFSSHLKNRVGLTLPKSANLRVNLNLDGLPITSKSHTHPSHSQTSRLLTSSVSLVVPVPRVTRCF